MSYGYASNVEQFITADNNAIVGQLIKGVSATGISSHESTQVEAWREEIRLLKTHVDKLGLKDWFIVLEYEIPRRSLRPDAILLNRDTIFVIEFKVGSGTYDAASCWQVNRYARDLRDFHAESAGRKIVPILCATHADTVQFERHPCSGVNGSGVTDLMKTNASNLGAYLLQFEDSGKSPGIKRINPDAWLTSFYRPMPSIIDAAKQLYEGHEVREISHRYAHNLDRTTEMLGREIEDARRCKRRVICFVTGVPGAGKTLTGLDVVHNPGLGQSPAGVFLSGNGPLVKVVREALVMNRSESGLTKKEREREVATFIQNVHQFLRYHLDNPEVIPHENVVVFDEAQRAWDALQMERKRKIASSEATLLLDVMERLPDWAVIIALVGGGQEIFLGEAGLEEWGRSLGERLVDWRAVASPEVLVGGASVAGHRLFEEGIPANVSFQEEHQAHLDVVVRSHRAQRWAEWVNEFLAGNFTYARTLFPEDSLEFPCFVTRDLDKARAWLRLHSGLDGKERTGLLATSMDHRLRAYGIERASYFRMNYPFEKWFLNPADDVRSSYCLEVAASEFECQGLELDWVGLCWGGDLTPSANASGWDYRKFRGADWQNVRKNEEKAYTLNRYRVLLTRARSGMVVWVPKGNGNDPTTEPERFDRVFSALQKAGMPLLEDYFSSDDLFICE